MPELSSNYDMDTPHSAERPSNLARVYQKLGSKNGINIMANLVGQTLGKYEITRLIARGGMADVYKARKLDFDREVAIKVMHGYLAHSDEFIARFKREAESIALLRHPHIIQLYDFDIDDEIYFMVMEFMKGGTLHQLMQQHGKLSAQNALDIILPLLDALITAHKLGIVHRDIKPANILFADEDLTHPVLSDFGITLVQGATGLTESGKFVGTPGYMSPEAGLFEPIDQRTDIYSMGVLLYEMLTGRLPYSGLSPFAIFMNQQNEPLPNPRLYAPALSESLVQSLRTALNPIAERRYQSVEAFKQALEEAYAVLPAEARQVRPEDELRAILLESSSIDLSTPIKSSQYKMDTPQSSGITRYAIIISIVVLMIASIAILGSNLFQNVAGTDLNAQADLLDLEQTPIVLTVGQYESSQSNKPINIALVATQIATEIVPTQIASPMMQESIQIAETIIPSPQATATQLPPTIEILPSATATSTPLPTALVIGDHLVRRLTKNDIAQVYNFAVKTINPAVLVVNTQQEAEGLSFDLINLDNNEPVIRLASLITGACIRIDPSINNYQLIISSNDIASSIDYSLQLIATEPETIDCKDAQSQP